MFSSFKNKGPADFGNNAKLAATLSNHIAEAAIQHATDLEADYGDLDKTFRSLSREANGVCAAAYEYWMFELSLIYRALITNMTEHGDADVKIFVQPIFNRIYADSKPHFLMMRGSLSKVKDNGTEQDQEFDTQAFEKVQSLAEMPLTTRTDDVGDNGHIGKESALGMTLRNIFDAMPFRRDVMMERQIAKDAIRLMTMRIDLYAHSCKLLRDNVPQLDGGDLGGSGNP